MGCPAPNVLSRWASGALLVGEGEALGAHLVGCEPCRRAVAAELGQAEDSPTEIPSSIAKWPSRCCCLRARASTPPRQKVSEVKPLAVFPAALGRYAFGLARALRAEGEHARHALGLEALHHYSAFPGFTRERARVEAWLTTR